MTPSALPFFGSILLAFTAWGIVASQYVWPRMSRLSRRDALRPVLLLHCFRFLGLAFLVPGVVSAELPVAFARSAAIGDIVAAVLALASLLLSRHRAGLTAAWIFNLWGAADLLFAFFEANRTGLQPGQLGAAYFIPTCFVPLLLITHVLAMRRMVGPGAARDGAVLAST